MQQPLNTGGDMLAGWPATDTLAVDPTWVSGYYLIRVLLLDGPPAGQVRDDVPDRQLAEA